METSPICEPFPIARFIHYGDFRYYYAYGNTRAEDFLQNAHGLKEPNILLLGCGDLRSCFYTLWKNFKSGITKQFKGVHFVMNDNSSAVIARDVLFLRLCLKMPQEAAALRKWISAFWAIWYSHELLPEHQQVLDDAMDNLIVLSKTSATWSSSDNPLHKLVKFSSCDTLREVRRMWIMWRTREIRIKSVKEMNKDRLAEQRAKIPDMEAAYMGVIIGSMCAVVVATLPDETQEIMKSEVANYMKTGTSFAEEVVNDTPVDPARCKTTPNLTFYEREDGKYTMHYGSVPFKCFYHTIHFSRQQLSGIGVSKGTVEQLLVKDSHFDSLPFLSNSVQQFALWLRSSASILKEISSSRAVSPITFVFNYSDAIDFCVRLQSPTFAKSLDCRTCFDLVYSSNLADHLALPNLVLSVLPLIKPGGLLFTSTLLYKTIASTAEECIHILFGLDIKLLPLVFGVRCINHEGDPYSSVVSIQPEPYEFGHLVAVKQWRKVLIWEKLYCLPLKHPSLLDKYDIITNNLCAAVCNATLPLLVSSKGHATINHLCVETAMRILHSFASQVEGDISSHMFWKPLVSLILKKSEIQPYIHCLQTQALLHEIHLHLTVNEDTCPMCKHTPLIDCLCQIGVEIEVSPLMRTPSFLIFVHDGTKTFDNAANLQLIATLNPSVHIIDSLTGVAKGKQLILYFYVPISFLHNNYSFTVVNYVLGEILGRELNIPSVVTTKRLVKCKLPSLTYSFQGTPPANPAPVTSLGALDIHAGNCKLFETVITVNEAVIPSLSALSPHQESPTEVALLLRSHKYVIVYPYPVDYDRLSIKLSRKQKTVTVLASRMAHTFESEKPLFVVNTSDEFAKLRVPMSNQTMITYSGMQFTRQDREIMGRCGRHHELMPPMINLKESMNFFFQCQNEHFFNIALPVNDVHALVVVQERVFDLQHRSPAVDMAFCLLHLSFVAKVVIEWQAMAPLNETRCITVNEAEFELLKKVLPYFARRTVGHSLSKAKKGHLRLLKRHKIDQYFTRAMVYPLFADPDTYVVDMEITPSLTKKMSLLDDETLKQATNETVEEKTAASTDGKRRCANCGKVVSEIKRCADCGKVKYCSRECQRKHWKIHKLECKKPSSNSKPINNKMADSESTSPGIGLHDRDCCSSCGRKSVKLKKCGACSKAWYCSQECQRSDWKEHKKVCKPLNEANPATSTEQDKSNSAFLPTAMTKCGGCERESSSLRPCPCHKIAYCSTACQRMDWTRHKKDCTAATKKH